MRRRLPPKFDEQEYVPDDDKENTSKPRQLKRHLPPVFDESDVILYDEAPKRKPRKLKPKRKLPPTMDEVILYDEDVADVADVAPKQRKQIKKNEVKKEVARPKRNARKPKKYLSDDDNDTTETLRSTTTSSIRDIIAAKGTFIDSGHEAQVYKYKGHAYKIFTSLAYPNRIQRNVDFLKNNKESGVVPQYINSNVKEGWIQMEYLDKYKPLKNKFVCTKQTEDCKLKFLKAICRARNKMSDNVHFTDLTKWDNIAYKITDTGKVKVKFYEGGENEKVSSGARRDFCYAMAKKMNIIRKAQNDNLL
jgi:hypothetical protein